MSERHGRSWFPESDPEREGPEPGPGEGTTGRPGPEGTARGEAPYAEGEFGRSAGDPAATEPVDEQRLRDVLHSSVADLEPSPDALERLQHAVPARRARRRQALVGAGAVAVLAVVGIPTVLFGDVLPSDDDGSPVTAHSSQGQTQGPASDPGAESTKGAEGEGKHGSTGDEEHDGADEHSRKPSDSAGSGTQDADPDDSLVASAPSCGGDQLGAGSGESGAADEQGRVYGSFRVSNTSGEACTVEGEGAVGAAVQGTSQRRTVPIVEHTAGDPAAGLPDPSSEPQQVVLKPGSAYLVRFAWIPDDASCTDAPSDENQGAQGDDGSGEGGEDGGEDGDDGESGGSTGGGDSADGRVVLTHTPEGGAPAADTAVRSSCAGTVYRTGILPAG